MLIRRTHLCSLTCLLVAALGMPLDAFATDYFVRKTGSNANAGTSAGTAWLTIDYAADNMSAGDTVYVGAGTYSERVTPSQSGTSGNPIRFIADTGGSQTGDAGDVLVTGSSGLETLNVSLNKDYLQFYNFKFQGSGNDTVRFYLSDNGVLDNCEIFGGTQGINAGNGNNFTVQDCIVRDNSSDGINVSFDTGMLVTGCEIYGNVTGIDVDSGGVTIRNCLIRDNSARGIDVTVGTVAVQNCTVVNNTSDGIRQQSGVQTVTNCILSSNGDDGLDYDAGTLTHTYNLIYGSGDLDYEGTSASTGEISLDPQFVSATDYRITTLSPARNAGTDLSGTVDDDFEGRARPYDGAYDMGCYEEGPLAHWKLDETSGTVAVDSSSYGNDGTYTNGPILGSAGIYGYSAEFDGSDDYVEVPDDTSLQVTDMTLSAWVYIPSSIPAGFRVIFEHGRNTLNWYGLYKSGISDGFHFRWGNTGTFNSDFYTTIVANQWYLVTATYNSTTSEARLYLNGQLDRVVTGATAPTPAAGGLRIGRTLINNNEEFPGMIDDARLYNRVLTDAEVATLYGLMGHWKMDEGAGSTIADSTAFSNDATVNGATWTSDCASNNGLEFDGISDTATTNATFDSPETGAVAFWMRSAGNPAAQSQLFGIGNDWEVHQETDGTLSFDLGGEGPTEFTTSEGLSFEDRWYHVIAQFDATDDSFEIYINGEFVKSGVNGDAMTKQLAGTLTLGTRTGSSDYWEGAMRDLRIYNRWLSGSEISELSGLVAYWKLDETTGTTAIDSSVNGHDGNYTNGVTLFQNGQVDQAAEFDGSDDYVGVTDDATLQMNDTFSISGWIRPDASTNVDQVILNKEGEYELAISSSDELQWVIKNTDPGWAWHGTGHVVLIGKWTHVALTYDNGTVSTYANGILVDTYNGSGSVGDQYTLLNELRLGGRSNNPTGKYFDGRIDDVRLFNRTLCPTEIFGQYKSGRPPGVRILKWVEVR